MNQSHFPDPSFDDLYRFDPALLTLRNQLEHLRPLHRIAFAVCCCERLFPCLLKVCQSQKAISSLRLILQRLWEHVAGSPIGKKECAKLLRQCDSLHFSSAASDSWWDATHAIDAMTAAIQASQEYSLDFSVLAANALRENVANVIRREILGPDYLLSPADTERLHTTIARHQLMTSEIAKQSIQIRFLTECDEMTNDNIALLRETCQEAEGIDN
jgi:uncharacterized protein YjaG (DUF416 family)